jgi:hypothetical protein
MKYKNVHNPIKYLTEPQKIVDTKHFKSASYPIKCLESGNHKHVK